MTLVNKPLRECAHDNRRELREGKMWCGACQAFVRYDVDAGIFVAYDGKLKMPLNAAPRKRSSAAFDNTLQRAGREEAFSPSRSAPVKKTKVKEPLRDVGGFS